MRHNHWMSLVSALLCAAAVGTASAQTNKAGPDAPQAVEVGTAFTYQGQLKKSGGPYTGACNLQFSLWDAPSAGTQVGSLLTLNNTSVTNGLFAVQLDFGNQFTGNARWMQTAVQCTGDAGFTTLAPRTALNAAPYAISLMPGATISTTAQNVPAIKVNALNANANALAAYGNGNGFAVVYGEDQSAGGGYGVAGKSTKGQGVYGVSSTQSGVVGESTSSSGVWGSSASWYGIDGVTSSDNYAGVRGTSLSASNTGSGVYGASSNGQGVKGVSTTGLGVRGESQDGYGVSGVSSSWIGVVGETTAGYVPGVSGLNNASNGIGVRGIANAAGAVGMWGQSNANTGVYGLSTDGNGLWGTSINGSGLYAQSTNGYAVNAYGSATQRVVDNGFVKAMVVVNPARPAGQQVVRCYNSQWPATQATVAPCGLYVSSSSLGLWDIDFGYDVSQRFAAVTAHAIGYCPDPAGCAGGFYHSASPYAQILSYSGTIVTVRIIYGDTLVETNAPFTLILY